MPKIMKLDPHVADMIAAGEVVERPASVVKELIENAIDAGATAVTVEIQNGGISYIRVADNGCGMSEEDAKNAFLRHATSKLRSAEDLNEIRTMGFRGEALAAISAVSRVTLITCEVGAEFGRTLILEGGEIIDNEPAGAAVGTTMIVRDLFFNTPARHKFLKRDQTEASYVATVIEQCAIAHPNVSIKFIKDGKEECFTPGNGDLKSTVRATFGRDFSNGLLSVEYEASGIKVSGFVSKPQFSRGNRSMQIFIVNGRPVKSRLLVAAVEEACKGSVMVGKFPGCVISVGLPPKLVDVNVHPAKTEVKFAFEKDVFNAVYSSIKNAISGDSSMPDIPKNIVQKSAEQQQQTTFNDFHQAEKKKTVVFTNVRQNHLTDMQANSGRFFRENPIKYELTSENTSEIQKKMTGVSVEITTPTTQFVSHVRPIAVEPPEDDWSAPSEKTETLQSRDVASDELSNDLPSDPTEIPQINDEESLPIVVIGEGLNTYIFAECDGKIYIIDKHAAHERILYEDVKRREKRPPSQILLMPITVNLSANEYAAVCENLELLNQCGFAAEDFGSGTILVREAPAIIDAEKICESIQTIARSLMTGGSGEVDAQLENIIHSIACKAAVKAGGRLGKAEMVAIAERVLNDSLIRHCPHGRPVVFELTKRELDRMFGRI